MLGAKIVLYDRQYWSQSADGTLSSQGPFLPANLVIFENSMYDNDKAIWDFADGIVTESIVASHDGYGHGRNPRPGRRVQGRRAQLPTGYVTVAPGLNPPEITMWGVARGFPRKFRLQAGAVMDIGPVANPIPVTEVFGYNPFGQ